jgi:1-acyl-sn-glycerol-3-phosphate acyltransferase
VAAKETMQSGILPRILSYVGAITVERTWRTKGKDVVEKKEVNPNDTENIKIALADGWVITFPQGTTKSFKPVRKGTAHIIQQHRPIVVPIVIDGFRRSFDKKGLRMKKKGILQSFIIKPPLEIDYDTDSVEAIVEKIEYAIEQHPSFLKVIPIEEIKDYESLNKLREW